MSVPSIRPTAIAVYVYRKTVPRASANSRGSSGKRAYEFLQIRRSAKARGHNLSWQTVYGGIERGETAIQAALRELKEETNLTPTRFFQIEFLETFYFRHDDSLLLMPVFAAEVSVKSKITLNREHTDHRWIPEKKIPQFFMWRTQREALGHVLEQLRHPTSAMEFLEIKIP